jgi:single-strand DNA-binding protein
MFNRVIIVGNLTRDIELKYAPSGTAIGSTGIASTRKFKGGDGAMKEEVLFVDITAFGRTAEVMNQYLKKGSKILVEGRLKLDSWTDQNGGKRSKHSVTIENMTMLDSKGDNANGGYNNAPSNSAPAYNAPQQNQAPAAQQQAPAYEKPSNDIPSIDINDDEIPF